MLTALTAALYLSVTYMIASGLVKSNRKLLDTDPSSRGLKFEDVEFSKMGVDQRLSGWYLPGWNGDLTLMMVPGNNQNRTEKDGVFLDIAERLVAQGFNLLMFDMRSQGRSGGDQVSYRYFERYDVQGAFDFLIAQGTPPEKIGVLSRSLGAAAAILGLADEPRIGALVADSPYAVGSELIVNEIGLKTPIPTWIAPVFVPGARVLTRALFDIDIEALAPEKAVARLDYPILVIHGTADKRAPFDHGERVYGAAHPESELWIIPESKHADAFSTRPDKYVDRVVEYFHQRLPDR